MPTTTRKCWPTVADGVPFDDADEPVPGLELELWAIHHAATCPVCRRRDAEVDPL